MRDLRNPLVWLTIVLTFVGVIGLLPVLEGAAQASLVGFLLSVAVWAVYGWVLWIIIRRVMRARAMPRGASFLALLWGGVIVTGLGTWATGAVASLVSSVVTDDGWASAIAAGLSEEPLKLMGVLALAYIPATRMRSTLDFVYYGLLVGLGFDVVESMLYSTQATSDGEVVTIVIMTLVLRGIIGGLWSHPTYTAIASTGLGHLLTSRSNAASRWLGMLAALLVSITLHIFFDSPLLEGNNLVAVVVKGLPALIVLIALVAVARRHARRREQDRAAVPDDDPSAPTDERSNV